MGISRWPVALRHPAIKALLKRKRETAGDDPLRPLLIQALASTLNGVAQGMRNTG